jgi:hypothetical protein
MFAGVIGFSIIYPAFNIKGRLLCEVGYEATTNQWFQSLGPPRGDEHGAE